MTTIDLTKRKFATQDEILVAFAERLRTIDQLSESNVVVSGTSVPVLMPKGYVCVSVSPASGIYDRKKWQGAGHATANEDGGVIIGCYQMNRRDPAGRSEEALLSNDSWANWKRRILSKLTVDDPLLREASPAWEPMRLIELTGVLEPMLREPPIPSYCTNVLDVDGHPGWTGFQLTMSCSWDWDLYG